MRLLLFTLFLAFWSTTVSAQWSRKPDVNTLKQQLNQNRQDSIRLRLCVAIAQNYFDECQYDSLYLYTKRGLQLLTNYPSHYYAGDLYFFLARYYRHRALYSRAIPPIQQAIDHAQQARSIKKTVEFQYALAVIYSDAGDLSNAADQIAKNLKYLGEHEDSPTLAANYLLIIELFRGLKNASMEEMYINKYIALDKRSWLPVDRMYAYVLKGEFLEKKGRLKEAEHQYKQALYCARLTNTPFRVIDARLALGINLRNQGQYQAAIQLFEKSFNMSRNLGSVANMAVMKVELATTYLACQRPKEALLQARYAIKLSRQNNQRDGIIAALKSLITILEANGQYQEALNLYKEEQQLKEQKYAEKNIEKIALMQAQFEKETNEKTIKILQKNAQINRLDTLHQQQQLILARRTQLAAAIIICLLVILMGVVYFFLRKSQRDYSILTDQQHLLQQTASELAETNALKDKLFSLISHDLRSPVASMKANIWQIREADKQPQSVLLMHRLEKQVDNVLTLLTNLLDWSMLQLKGFQLFLEPIHLCEIVEETISQASELIHQKQLIVINQVEPSLLIRADRHQLQAIVRNILGNAIKFTPPDGYIRMQSVVQGEHAELQIRDSGIGMSAEQIDMLFSSPEVRTGTMGENGIGLGLRICREMLDRQGGTLRIESRPNGGTLVRIRLAVLSAKYQMELS